MTIFEIFTVLMALVILAIQKMSVDKMRRMEKNIQVHNSLLEKVKNELDDSLVQIQEILFQVQAGSEKTKNRMKKKLVKLENNLVWNKGELQKTQKDLKSTEEIFNTFRTEYTEGFEPLEKIHSLFQEQIKLELDPNNPQTEFGKIVKEEMKMKRTRLENSKSDSAAVKRTTAVDTEKRCGQRIEEARRRIIKFYSLDLAFETSPARHLVPRQKQIEEFVQSIRKMFPKLKKRKAEFPGAPSIDLFQLESCLKKLEV